MHIRVINLNVRNPILGAGLLIAAVGLLLAFIVFGLTLLVAATAVGAVALVARQGFRLLRPRRPALEPLDSAQEIFPPGKPDERLPRGGGE